MRTSSPVGLLAALSAVYQNRNNDSLPGEAIYQD